MEDEHSVVALLEFLVDNSLRSSSTCERIFPADWVEYYAPWFGMTFVECVKSIAKLGAFFL
jgi:hypothetical protein